MLDFLDEEFNHPDFNNVDRILVNLKEYKFNPGEVNKINISKLKSKYMEKSSTFTIVFLTDTGIETAFACLCETYLKNSL